MEYKYFSLWIFCWMTTFLISWYFEWWVLIGFKFWFYLSVCHQIQAVEEICLHQVTEELNLMWRTIMMMIIAVIHTVMMITIIMMIIAVIHTVMMITIIMMIIAVIHAMIIIIIIMILIDITVIAISFLFVTPQFDLIHFIFLFLQISCVLWFHCDIKNWYDSKGDYWKNTKFHCLWRLQSINVKCIS